MNPMSKLGAVDAVASIVGAIVETVSTLRKPHANSKEADQSVSDLVSHINTPNAAFGKNIQMGGHRPHQHSLTPLASRHP